MFDGAWVCCSHFAIGAVDVDASLVVDDAADKKQEQRYVTVCTLKHVYM